MKQCKTCRKHTPLSNFSAHPHTRDKLAPNCKPCKSSIASAYYEKNKEAVRLKLLTKNYGLTPAAYLKMYEGQGGCCAICNVEEKDAPKQRLSVDHDHTTGDVRALLCNTCNTGIGLLKDSPALLREATAYLIKHGK
mgnify:CR=1 FL=1